MPGITAKLSEKGPDGGGRARARWEKLVGGCHVLGAVSDCWTLGRGAHGNLEGKFLLFQYLLVPFVVWGSC